MKKIIHISDLHFGKIDEPVLRDLITSIAEISPDVLVVSGDLTQRARSAQFIEAAEFLARFNVPKIIVPGNHDIPLYNVFDRFVNPLEKYNRYISTDMMPSFFCEDMAVIGLNTARSLTIKDGRLNHKQINAGAEQLSAFGDEKIKIIVTHHPLDIPDEYTEEHIPENADEALRTLTRAGADMFLSGHLHLGRIVHLNAVNIRETVKNVLMIQAGTACSTRSRIDHNSFNLITIANKRVEAVEMIHSVNKGFTPAFSQSFLKGDGGWITDTSTPDNFHL